MSIQQVVIGVALGGALTGAFGLFGATWGLAGLNGVAGCALVLALSLGRRDGTWDVLDWAPPAGNRAAAALATFVILLPAFLLDDVLGIGVPTSEFGIVDQFGLSLLLMLTGWSAYFLGGLVGVAQHRDRNVAGEQWREERRSQREP